MPASTNRKRLLYVLHAYHNRAGTEAHTKILAAGLKEEFRIGIVFPFKGRIVYREEDTGEEVIYPGEQLPWPTAPYRSPVIEHSLNTVLQTFAPDIIHIQHSYEWPLCLIDLLATTSRPILMSFHEYYAVTPYFTMEGAENPEDTFAEEYVIKTFKQDIRKYLQQRRDLLGRCFDKLVCRIVPSHYLATVLNQIYPGTYKIIPHGIEPFGKVTTVDEPPLKFGYVGSLLPQKGWRTILEPFQTVKKEYPSTELHVFGGGQKYEGPHLPGITFHGVYDPPDLPSILSKFHVGVIPSLFAETFSLSLSEMWEAGRIAAVSDIGVFKERVQDGLNGKKFKPGDADSIADTFRFFLAEEGWRSWQCPQVRYAKEMCQEYKTLYASFLSQDS